MLHLKLLALFLTLQAVWREGERDGGRGMNMHYGNMKKSQTTNQQNPSRIAVSWLSY